MNESQIKQVNKDAKERDRGGRSIAKGAYGRKVNRAKSAWEENQKTELEVLMKHSKQWWKELKKLNLVDKRSGRSDVVKVKDLNGEVTQGNKAVMVWKDHLEGVLNA